MLKGACIMQSQPELSFTALNSIPGADGFSHSTTFSADWHPQLGERLAGFPRCIRLEEAFFWPDFATFVDADECSWLCYYPESGSVRSMQVVVSRAGAEPSPISNWQISEYVDADAVRCWTA